MNEQTIYISGVNAELETWLLARVHDLKLKRVNEPRNGTVAALAVIDVAHLGANAYGLVGSLAAGGSRVIVVGASKDPDVILQAMRAGAREFVVATEPAKLESALRGLVGPAEAPVLGKITTVFPAKGGMGATSIATNLAGIVASGGSRTCLVDLDLELGDVLAALDMQGGYSLGDLLANMHRLDRELLDSSLPRHASGVAVLAQGGRVEDGHVGAEAVAKALTFLRGFYEHILVDGVRGFGDSALAALDASDRVLLVVTQEIASVRNAQRCIDLFRKLGYPEDKVLLVVNRWHKASRITKEVIAESTGMPIAAALANDFAALTRSINRGTLLPQEAPRAALTRDVEALAAVLRGASGSPAPRARGPFGRLFAARA